MIYAQAYAMPTSLCSKLKSDNSIETEVKSELESYQDQLIN